MKQADWNSIKAEYLSTDISYRKLAEKHKVSPTTLYRRLKNERWTELRKQTKAKVDAKISNDVAKRQAKQVSNIESIADLLLKKIQEGVESGTLIVDSQSIRQITASIKDLKDIKGLKSDADAREQEARIKKLIKDAEEEKQEDKTVKVIIEADAEKYGI